VQGLLKGRQNAGDTLHEIVNSRETFHVDDVLRVLQSVVFWKTEKELPLDRPDAMVAANADLHMAVNSSGFRKYFETSAGDQSFHIRDILELGGDAEASAAFRNVLVLFPDGEPSLNTEQRRDQIGEIDSRDPNVDVFVKHDRIRHPMNYPSDEAILRALHALPNQQYLPELE
jgi:hypothetical protein